MKENCFVEQNKHHFYQQQHQQDNNYIETSPQYYNMIKTQPVASSTSQSARLLRNDHQCAMTTEETRRLTGLVAKTRALFESSLQTSVNSNNELNNMGVNINTTMLTPVRPLLPNSISNSASLRSYANEASNNYTRIKQSFSANNVNNMRKISVSSSDHDDAHNNESSTNKENKKTNFIKINQRPSTLMTNSTPVNTTVKTGVTKLESVNLSSTNYTGETNANMTDEASLSRPSFIKIKRFQSPSLSQSYQMFDSGRANADASTNGDKEMTFKKSLSTNRIIFSSNENSQKMNSRIG